MNIICKNKYEKNFRLAFFLSILLHLLIMFPLAALDILPKQKALNEVEVNYFKLSSKHPILVKRAAGDSHKKELEKIGLGQRIILSDKDEFPEKNLFLGDKSVGDDLFAKIKNTFQKPSLPQSLSLPRSDIKLTLFDSSKSQSPVYLSYRNFLHENLRRYLYDRYSNSAERGEVYLTFVLNSNGSVKDAQIIDSKSNASPTLKRIVLESVYAASPFPPLPEALNSPLLSFSVTVQFKEQKIKQ